jgi:hypothetical protein
MKKKNKNETKKQTHLYIREKAQDWTSRKNQDLAKKEMKRKEGS